jgi:hypothetical protein
VRQRGVSDAGEQTSNALLFNTWPTNKPSFQKKEHIMNRPERTFATPEIRVERRLPSYWRVTFDLPPLNIFGPKETLQLGEIITAIERDEEVKVVVFNSAVDGFFLTTTTS